ncbi:hypothetical protein GQ53DRAFT_814288 [Thozetella sp. PMI_491]|nr:hypothetical protein GQ53DRAFT_814288 [Thozetella sp. PMI_491]
MVIDPRAQPLPRQAYSQILPDSLVNDQTPPAPPDPNLVVVQPEGASHEEPPLYCVFYGPGGKSVIYYGQAGPTSAIGDISVSTMNSSATASLRGQPMKLRQNCLSGDYTIDFPPIPDLKWEVNQLTGHSMNLKDRAGTRLAHYDPGWSEKSKLDIVVQCDERLVEAIVISAMALAELNKKSNEMASEVLQAVFT